MTIYLIMFIYFFINIVQNKKITKFGYIFLQSFMIIFLSFTYKMGGDWINYQNLYNNIENIDIFKYKQIEVGYSLYNLVMKKVFGFNYEIFMGITIGICVYILLRELKKKVSNYYLAVFLFFSLYLYQACFEPVVRQLIATTILIYSLKYIEEKKLLKYVIFMILAATFHRAAILFIGIYFLDKMNFKLRNIFFLIVIGFVATENTRIILDLLTNIVPSLSKFKIYLDNELYGLKKADYKILIKTLVRVSIFLYIIFYSYQFSFFKKNYIKNSAIISCILLIFIKKFYILYRINNYLLFFFAISLSFVGELKLKNNKKLKYGNIIFPTLILFVFSLQYYKIITGNSYAIYKYGNYKNYFIELLKGNILENDETKIKNYMKGIEASLKKDEK